MGDRIVELKVRDVALAAKKAFDEGRLSAQNGGVCQYRSGQFPCAIGAALSDADAKRFDRIESSSVTSLIDLRKIRTDDAAALVALQDAHDAWACGRPRTKFVTTLNRLLKATA